MQPDFFVIRPKALTGRFLGLHLGERAGRKFFSGGALFFQILMIFLPFGTLFAGLIFSPSLNRSVAVNSRLRNLLFALITSLLAIVVLTDCSARFVKRKQLRELNKELGGEKIYVLQKTVDIGNGKSLEKGARVRIWFESNTFSVKVKGYKVDEERESAWGKNIIYLHEGEFKNENYDKAVLMKKFGELLVPDDKAKPEQKK